MHDIDLARMTSAFVGPPDDEIIALEARIRDAQLRADVAALDVLISDDLLFTGPNGQLATKAEDLEGRIAIRASGHARTGRGGSPAAM